MIYQEIKFHSKKATSQIECFLLLLDNDIPESRLRDATSGADAGRACADVTSGREQPEASTGNEKKPPRVRDVLLGLRKVCREKGMDEAFTAYLVGRLALDLCDADPPI